MPFMSAFVKLSSAETGTFEIVFWRSLISFAVNLGLYARKRVFSAHELSHGALKALYSGDRFLHDVVCDDGAPPFGNLDDA